MTEPAAAHLTAAPPHAGTVRLQSLDLLRGLCAIAVALYHFAIWSEAAVTPATAGLLAIAGTYGVSVFFILSGYSLAHAYAREFQDQIVGSGAMRYFRRRIGRLAPLFALVVLASLAGRIVTGGNVPSAYALIGNFTLLFGFVDPADTPVIGGWSIGIEVVFYLVMPMMVLLRRYLLLTVIVAVFMTAWLTMHVSAIGNLEDGWKIYVQPANHFVFFAFGVFARMQFGLGTRIGSLMPLLFGSAATVGIFALLFAGASAFDVVTGWSRLVLVASASAIVVLFAMTDMPRWAVPVCVALGGLSYPMYLIHPIAFFALKKMIDANMALLPLLFVAVTIAALIVDQWIDKPIQVWVKRNGW